MSTADRPVEEVVAPSWWRNLDPYDPRFPTSDGKPMADSISQYRWMVTIQEGLDLLFRDRDVLVACNILWYFDRDDPRKRLAPDVLVAFDRPRGDRGSYKQWFEGTPPHVVFEIHSKGNRPGEMLRKQRQYDALGVEEYYYYNPVDAWLRGWLRDGGELRRIEDVEGLTSPRLGITFTSTGVKEGLVILGPDGEPFQHAQEVYYDRKVARELARDEKRRRLQAELRAEAERERAEAERARAEAERARAELLEARLRELGEWVD
ncbi:Uma2 family endonuclease [Paludisphaera sp.]|uniref:Uma2 family endonuclease n=1 Tax=Paludisphaera sp. TaxID=2017432 RepID=UPI00301B8015